MDLESLLAAIERRNIRALARLHALDDKTRQGRPLTLADNNEIIDAMETAQAVFNLWSSDIPARVIARRILELCARISGLDPCHLR